MLNQRALQGEHLNAASRMQQHLMEIHKYTANQLVDALAQSNVQVYGITAISLCPEVRSYQKAISKTLNALLYRNVAPLKLNWV
jgi:hypothetical protein